MIDGVVADTDADVDAAVVADGAGDDDWIIDNDSARAGAGAGTDTDTDAPAAAAADFDVNVGVCDAITIAAATTCPKYDDPGDDDASNGTTVGADDGCGALLMLLSIPEPAMWLMTPAFLSRTLMRVMFLHSLYLPHRSLHRLVTGLRNSFQKGKGLRSSHRIHCSSSRKIIPESLQ